MCGMRVPPRCRGGACAGVRVYSDLGALEDKDAVVRIFVGTLNYPPRMTATTLAQPPPPRDVMRHACTDGPSGILIEEAPEAREEALALKQRHADAFWCSLEAGGCGQKVELTAGQVRIPYFRHLPGHSACAVGSSGNSTGDAYAHLVYQVALSRWLLEQDYSPVLEQTFPDDGGRADLHVEVDGARHSVEVQLSPLTEVDWQERTAKYAQHVNATTWMFGPDRSTEARRALLADGEVAWRLKVVEGAVLVGTIAHDFEEWAPLTACTFDAAGVHSPHEAAAREASRAYRTDQDAKVQAEREKREAARRRPIEDAIRRARDRGVPLEALPTDAPRRAVIPHVWPRPVALVVAQYPEFTEWAAGPGATIGVDLEPQLAHIARVTAYVACELSVSGVVEAIAFADVSHEENVVVWVHLADVGAVDLKVITGLGTRWTRLRTFR